MQISRLPVGLSNRPPPHIDFFAVNLLHNYSILPHPAVFVNTKFEKFWEVRRVFHESAIVKLLRRFLLFF